MQLSDKAKGKRRATYPDDDDSASVSGLGSAVDISSPIYLPTELTIRFTEGVPDVAFSIDSSYTVKDVKILIREYRPTLSNRRLRLVHRGRILPDNTFIQTWLSKFSTVPLHTNFSSTAPLNEDEIPLLARSPTTPTSFGSPTTPWSGIETSPSTTTAWVHCAIGPVITPEEDEQMPEQTTQITPLRGFDRLLASGSSESEIASVRRQFHAESGMGGENLQDIEFADDNEYEEHALRLEDAWLDSLQADPTDGTPSIAHLQAQTNYQASVTQGLFMGFFFPLLPFFFFWAPRDPIFWDDGREPDRSRSVVFSMRTQVAVLFGLAVNLIFGLYRMLVSGY